MKIIRKLIPVLGLFMGVWVLASFGGVMFNVTNAGFWTTSLMWSLLASLLIMPGLVVLHHATASAGKPAPDRPSSHPSLQEQPDFVPEEEQEGMLWPEGEKDPASQK
jgi:hypothetical protein